MRPLSSQSRLALERETARHEANIESAREYLGARALNRDIVARFRLGVVNDGEDHAGRLAIPAIGPNGVYSIRYRSIQNEEPKYLGHDGLAVRLFNLRALHEATDEIHITEGEIDAISLEQCGLHAVGVPGVNGWKKHHHRMFAGFSKVFVWEDGDSAGRSFAKKVCNDISSARHVSLEADSDPNSLLVKEGADGIHEALRRASE